MAERRSTARQKTFLQGRIYFNNRRSSMDCLIRDVSDTGARVRCSEAVTVPEVLEFYIPNRETVHRARVEWRRGNEIGLSFIEAATRTSAATDAEQGDLAARMQRLETELAALRHIVNELRAEGHKLHGDAA